MLNSPLTAYTAIRNPLTDGVSVYYNDPKVRDEERIYTFNPDGSASVQSCAWGNKSECPKGTFSDLMLKLPNTEKINSQIAHDLACAYDNFSKNNSDKLKITWANRY